MNNDYLLYGRELSLREAKEKVKLADWEREDLKVKPAMTLTKRGYQCERCGTVINMSQSFPCICKETCVYCKTCLILGKIRRCDRLVSLEEPNLFLPVKGGSLKWEGRLSAQQKKASVEISQSIQCNKERVVWAVTGAGKTEMLFEGIGQALDDKKRVCIASPRVDVCLELKPRLQHAFSETSVSLLYGHSEERYTYTQLVIATTHQLLRFKEAFDVLIIDEIDAFPYFNNEMLYYASNKAVKKKASTIYLTATPDKLLKNKMRNHLMDSTILPARYHGYPLPVPTIIRLSKTSFLSSVKRPYYEYMLKLLKMNKKFLLFVPTVHLMEQVMKEIEPLFIRFKYASVHSKDTMRKEKVNRMRLGHYDFLLTTTILERGVTFSGIDVIVFRAEHRVYNEAALIQIAGRAGRSKDDPSGEVIFYCDYLNREIKSAVREIKNMNRLAEKKGLLK